MLDAIVVGAGIGGLVAAVELAARGRRVVVYERDAAPGGKVAVTTSDGVEIDTGPSLLTWPAALEATFVRAGTTLRDHLTLVSPDPSFRYLWRDGTRLDLRRGREGAVASVREALGTQAASELDAFLDYAKSIWDIAVPEFLEQDAPDFFGLLRRGLPGLRAARGIDAFSTMRGAIADRIRTPQLRHVLLRFATYAGSDPRRTPATLSSVAHVEMTMGAFGVKGGMIQIARALAEVAQARGVTMRYGAEVERIVVDHDRCRGIALAGGAHVAARCVISNADVAHLHATLLPREHRDALGLPEERTTSGLNIVVRDPHSAGIARAAHAVAFAREPDEEVTDLFDRRCLPRDPTVYACVPRLAHERTGWPDADAVFLMVCTPALRGPEVADEIAALEQRTLARAVEAGLISDRATPVWRRSPAGLAERFPDSAGALYGPASHGWAAAFRRTPNALPGIAGLYVASGSAHPGGGVPLAALSGRAAARCALRELA